jgi:transmembrane protein 33
MRITAYAELIILARVTLGALTLQNSFLTPIFYAHFVRQRYYHSQFTRAALVTVHERLDLYAANPALPPIINQIWSTFKRGVVLWGGNTLSPQAAAGVSGRRTST